MRVLILSGNQAGSIVDLPRPEAEAALSTGYAALAPEPGPITPTEAELVAAVAHDNAEKPRRLGSRASHKPESDEG